MLCAKHPKICKFSFTVPTTPQKLILASYAQYIHFLGPSTFGALLEEEVDSREISLSRLLRELCWRRIPLKNALAQTRPRLIHTWKNLRPLLEPCEEMLRVDVLTDFESVVAALQEQEINLNFENAQVSWR